MLNKLIDILPFEAHVPGYNYCGPGTRLDERLKRGDKGVNKLDEACKEHDIAYSRSSDVGKRHEADKILAQKAWDRVKASDSSLGERATALGVVGSMKAKVALGSGLTSIRGEISRKKPRTLRQAVAMALKVARKSFPAKTHKKAMSSRVLSIPKEGGFLMKVVPAVATMAASGNLPGGINKVVDVVNSIVNRINKSKRDGKDIGKEGVKIGGSLRLKPYRKGYGLYLSPWHQGKLK